jgi:hypothetical protein
VWGESTRTVCAEREFVFALTFIFSSSDVVGRGQNDPPAAVHSTVFDVDGDIVGDSKQATNPRDEAVGFTSLDCVTPDEVSVDAG